MKRIFLLCLCLSSISGLLRAQSTTIPVEETAPSVLMILKDAEELASQNHSRESCERLQDLLKLQKDIDKWRPLIAKRCLEAAYDFKKIKNPKLCALYSLRAMQIQPELEEARELKNVCDIEHIDWRFEQVSVKLEESQSTNVLNNRDFWVNMEQSMLQAIQDLNRFDETLKYTETRTRLAWANAYLALANLYLAEFTDENSSERYSKSRQYIIEARQYDADDPLVKKVRWLVLKTIYGPLVLVISGAVFLTALVLLFLLLRRRHIKSLTQPDSTNAP